VKAARRTVKSACVVCRDRSNTQQHHIGGRRHLVWITAPLCPVHHEQLHRLLKIAGVDLEYTDDPVERLIRATKAISIFMCMVQDALHKARQRKR
jgi:hypothetical protein